MLTNREALDWFVVVCMVRCGRTDLKLALSRSFVQLATKHVVANTTVSSNIQPFFRTATITLLAAMLSIFRRRSTSWVVRSNYYADHNDLIKS